MISEGDGVVERFEGAGEFGAGDEVFVGYAAEGEDDVIEIELSGVVISQFGGDLAFFDVYGFDIGLNESNLVEHTPNWIHGMARLEYAAAGFEEKGGH